MSDIKCVLKSECFRVLSIQSHVVHGYVGNKSAVFPLQVLGFEVDYLNSVQLSNHTGYLHVKGQVLNSTELEELISGLVLNGLHHYSHLLTGYVGSSSFLHKIIDVVKQMKANNPDLVYVCDPVMGDGGQLYVPKELLDIYKEEVIPLADIITPNQFEAELLTGISIKTEDDIIQATELLHGKGIRTVVITSSCCGSPDMLVGMGSFKEGKQCYRVKFEIPKLQGNFVGAGDIFAAVFLAWMAKTGNNLSVSCEKTASTLFHILKRTLNAAQKQCEIGETPTPSQMELKMIQSKADIENPEIVIYSVDLNT